MKNSIFSFVLIWVMMTSSLLHAGDEQSGDPFSLENSVGQEKTMSTGTALQDAGTFGLLSGVLLYATTGTSTEIYNRIQERHLGTTLRAKVPESILTDDLEKLFSLSPSKLASEEGLKQFQIVVQGLPENPEVAALKKDLDAIVKRRGVEHLNKLSAAPWVEDLLPVALEIGQSGVTMEIPLHAAQLEAIRSRADELALIVLRGELVVAQIPNGQEAFQELISRNAWIKKELEFLNTTLDDVFMVAKGEAKGFTRTIIRKVITRLETAIGNAPADFGDCLERILLADAEKNYGVFEFKSLAALNTVPGLTKLNEIGLETPLDEAQLTSLRSEIRRIVVEGSGQFNDVITSYYTTRPEGQFIGKTLIDLHEALQFERKTVQYAREGIARLVSGYYGAFAMDLSRGGYIVLTREMALDGTHGGFCKYLLDAKDKYKGHLKIKAAAIASGVAAGLCLVPIVYEAWPETVDTEKDGSSSEADDSDLGK